VTQALPRTTLFVIVSFLMIYACFLPVRGVWAPDEARYAEVVREMEEGARWVVPALNGELYGQKPPLFFVAGRIASLGSDGVPEWAVKAPSLVGALGTLLIVSLLAALYCGRRAAWIAPLFLGTMGKFVWNAQFGQIDMLLTFLVTAQVYLGLRTAEGMTGRRKGILCVSLLGFAGVLAKGPVGCFLPWLVLTVFLSLRKDWDGLRRLNLPLIALLVAALSAGWLIAAGLLAGWDYPQALLFKQTVRRALDPWHHKGKPFYYYFFVLVSQTLPYSLMSVPLAAPLIRGKTWREPGALLPLSWILCYLVFFSLLPGKRDVYVLPAFPALALLLAFGAERWVDGRFPVRGVRCALAVFALLSLAAGGILLMQSRDEFGGVASFLLIGLVLLAAGSAAAWVLTGRDRISPALLCVPSGIACLLLVGVVPSLSRLDRLKTPRDLIPQVRPLLEEGGTLAVYPNLIPAVNYYLETLTPVFDESQGKEAAAFLGGDVRNRLLVQDGDWKGSLPPGIVAHTLRIGGDTHTLYAPGPPGTGERARAGSGSDRGLPRPPPTPP